MGKLDVDLDGKVAIVSGGSSGMGAAIANRLGSSGAAIVVGGRDDSRTNGVVAQIIEAGGAGLAVLGDVAASATADLLVASALDEFGRLDVVVSAAGVIHRADAMGTDDEQWRHTMSVNVDGPFYLSRAAIPALRNGGGGSIVNVSSTCGLVGSAGLAAYCASKGAVSNLTRAMALDHAAEGIRVNAVCPGAVDTPMLGSGHPAGRTIDDVRASNIESIPEGRIPSPEEIADVVLFLASDASRHITGTNVSVDGGYTAQ